jgi:hypothetical protein
LNRLVRPNNAQIFVFFPFPGTELHDQCKKEGYLSHREKTTIFEGESVLNLPTLTNEHIVAYTQAFKKMAHQIKLEKEQKGDYDFLVTFSEANVVADADNYVGLSSAIINGDERHVIFAHPESKITFPLTFRETASLHFGIALSALVWSEDKGLGVDFEITLNDNGEEHLVFSKYIDPKNNPGERTWHDFKLLLPQGKSAVRTLTFITTTRKRDNQFCWAVWAHPFLVKEGSGEAATAV